MRVIFCLLLLLTPSILTAQVLHIAAASNFQATAKKINTLFERRFGHKTTISSASTGALYSQIVYGAPFAIFFAADVDTPKKLENNPLNGATLRSCYALGSLVLVGSDNIQRDLANPLLSIAIANPNTAPYGKAALTVLSRSAFSAGKKRKLIRASNAIQAYQHWHSGTVNMALVPRAIAGKQGSEIPSNWYTAIEQHVIMLRKGADDPAAKTYMRWLGSEEVQTLIVSAGYKPCP
ncbi:MAG: molybdate transport system substrate-binding protein [Halioglobus sp.]|jgi:molybdate transport system substrate-binding protein